MADLADLADRFGKIKWSAVDWATATTAVAAAVTTLIVLITAWFAVRQLKDAGRTRTGELLTDLSRRWDEPLLITSQKLFADFGDLGIERLVHRIYERGGATDEEVTTYTALEALPNLWEAIGVLETERAISLKVVDKMWGAAITEAWAGWKPAIARLRRATNNESSYVCFEALADKLTEYRKLQALPRWHAAILRARKRWPIKALAKALALVSHVPSLLRHRDQRIPNLRT